MVELHPTGVCAEAKTGPSGGTPEDALTANSGKATLFNPIAAPMAAVSSDFGTKFITAGLGFLRAVRWGCNLAPKRGVRR